MTTNLATNQPQKRGSARRQPEPPPTNNTMKPETDTAGPIRAAENLIQKIIAANEAREAARAATAANAERLQKLGAEIEALERKVSIEDFPALTELAARKDQRDRLAKKFEADAAAADRAADAAADALTDSEISNLFWAIKSETKSRIVSAIRPFFADAAKAERAAASCDSIVLLDRYANCFGSLPPEQKLSALLPVLKQIKIGRPPWLFGDAESISTDN
jgi:hypothetical protein